jgi:hypothetical protein
MMRSRVLTIQPDLARARRMALPWEASDAIQTIELLTLILAGVAAAVASTFLDFSLKIPGHAIMRAVFPMACGLAMAPRRGAGSVMGASALASALLFKVGGVGTVGMGAVTSLALTGPLLDVALWRAKRGWRIYLAFATAGILSNLVALTARGSVKMAGLDHIFGLPFAIWWIRAVPSYMICGLLAGLLSACIWFRLSGAREGSADPESPE